MPVKQKAKPEIWEEIEKGEFYINIGQYNVKASKFMTVEPNNIDKDIKKHFRKWNCFVIWSSDVQKLQNILAYYNRTNHFLAVQPS